ncbi:MAG TPA: hypothetical protein VII23_01095 [Terriglobales bacterium]
MALVLVCDTLGRFVASDLIAFRTWEAALEQGLQLVPGHFKPKVEVRVHGAYGDLANMGNMRFMREYHDEELRTDELGFRNSYDIFDTQYGGVVLGDSFVVASSLPEGETLPIRLSQIANAHFYNAGGSGGLLMPDEAMTLAATLKMQPGVVVCELLERFARLSPPSGKKKTIVPFWAKYLQHAAPGGAADPIVPWLVSARVKLSPENSPMTVLSERLVKRFKNGKLQPNTYANRVVHATLQNGDQMLFLPEDLEPVGDVNKISAAWAKYFEWYNNSLKQKGWKLVVCLVPNKYTVYGPIIEPPAEALPGVALNDRIAEQLESAGITVVNLTHHLRTQAAEGLAARKYVYWRDDTHWNAVGIDVAAEDLRKYVTNHDVPDARVD